jgi:putative ABC transport system permease protein
MSVLLRPTAILVVAARRLFAQWGLAAAITIGLTVSVALAVSLPLYADAVNFRILVTELGAVPGTEGQIARRSPFALMFRYLGSLHKPLKWSAIEPVDSYLRGLAAADLGLPRKLVVRHVATNNLKLFAQKDFVYSDTRQPLGWISLGTITDLAPHITLVEGRFPAAAPASQESPIEALVSEALATRLGLQVGETYIGLDTNETLRKGQAALLQIPLRVAGIWQAADPADPFWFYDPAALTDVLLLPEASLRDRIGSQADSEVFTALWYLVMDGATVNAANAERLLGRILTTQRRADSLLPFINLDTSPVEALRTYELKTAWLSILLYAFSIPIMALVLAFVGMSAGLSVERQRSEIAVFRSRGATVSQVLGINLLESLLLGAMALAVGVIVGQALARLIGHTRGFLDFSGADVLRVVLTPAAVQFGVVLLGLTVVAQVAPALGAARHTVVTYKQERARTLRAPWWQRAWLDVLLLIPAGYAAYLLRQQGSVVVPAAGPALAAQANALVSNALPSDPFQNPLLFLAPALAVFALTLLMLRLLRPLMAAFAWLAGRTRSVGVLLAARYLARNPSHYATPLVLLILTLSLSAYTASLAQTLDDHTYDQAFYETGADMRLVEGGQAKSSGGLVLTGLPGMGDAKPPEGAATGKTEGAAWEILPVGEHLKAPGVAGAIRVARYPAAVRLSNSLPTGVFMGVDRAEFARVAFWRRDFASANLGALMNALAAAPNSVLVSRQTLAQNGLAVGDRLRLAVEALGSKTELDVVVAGWFDLFPAWYPQQGALFVGNLDYLFEKVGAQVPYDVWLKVDGTRDGAEVVAGLRKVGFQISYADDAVRTVQRQLRRPERQGIFGVLSVGFAAAAFLSAFGFLLYALFSFRRRFVELGMLRAIGLSASQMTVLLASELAFLILMGLAAGTVLGAGISELFIPSLQIGNTPASRIPPYLVSIGWPTIIRIYGLLGLLFLGTLIILAALLLRMRVFQAIKLGETT